MSKPAESVKVAASEVRLSRTPRKQPSGLSVSNAPVAIVKLQL